MPKKKPDDSRKVFREKSKAFSKSTGRLKSLKTLPNRIGHDEIGNWCRSVQTELARLCPKLEDRIAAYQSLRQGHAEFTAKLAQNAWASKHGRSVVDAIEGIEYTRSEEVAQFAPGLRKLLPAAFKNGHDRDPTIRMVATAALFLCTALDCKPSVLLRKITRHRDDFDALSADPDRTHRESRHIRENLYCLLTFLQVQPDAAAVSDILEQTKLNRDSEQLHRTRSRAQHPLFVGPAIFYAYVESLYVWRYEPWQTPARKIRHHFRWNADFLLTYIERLKAQIDNGDLDVEAQVGSEAKAVEAKEKQRLALEFVVGKRSRNRTSNPGRGYAVMLRSLYEGYLQYCVEHAAVISAAGAYGHAKLHKEMTAAMQLRILNAYDELVGGAFVEDRHDLMPALKVLLQQRLKKGEKHAQSLTMPIRFVVACFRGAVAQGVGRAIGASLSLYALSQVGDANILGPVAALFVVEVLMLVSSAGYLIYRHQKTTTPNNHRRITKFLFWSAMAASLCTPIIAAACQALNDDLELEIDALFARNASDNGTEAEQTRLGFLLGVHESGGTAAWLIGNLLTAHVARTIRQIVQTTTVSEYSAGTSITYLDNTPLSDDDREEINALRDVLYVASSMALLSAPLFVSVSPAVWGAILLSLSNEAVDEINPDVAVLIANFFRGARATYNGSNARFAIHRGSTPRLASFAQFKNHVLPQGASRLSISGVSDLLNQAGDILKIRNNASGSQALKMLSVLIGALFGARRGATVGYMTDGGGSIPSGLPSFLLRWFFRDAVDRIQARPAVSTDLVSLQYDEEKGRFGKPRLIFPWTKGRHLQIDGALLANVFAPDEFKTFHQCEHEQFRIAVLNMLIMHYRNDRALLLGRSSKAMDSFTLPELCAHLNERRVHSATLDPPSPYSMLPELASKHLKYSRTRSWEPQDFDAASAACLVYKDADHTRAVFVKRVSDVEVDIEMDDVDEDVEQSPSSASIHPEESQFRVYSPLLHRSQLDTFATTMSEALRKLLADSNAPDQQTVDVAYCAIHVASPVMDPQAVEQWLDQILRELPPIPSLPAPPVELLTSPSQARTKGQQNRGAPPKNPSGGPGHRPPEPIAHLPLDKVNVSDCFSGAVNTLINDFLSHWIGIEDDPKGIRAHVDQVRRKASNKRPKWSDVPDALSTDGMQFIFAKARLAGGNLSLSDSSGGALRPALLDSLWTLAVSHKRNQDDLRSVLFRNAEDIYVAADVKSGKVLALESLLLPDSMGDALQVFMENEKVSECSLLFIAPPRLEGRSHIESSSSDASKGSQTRSHSGSLVESREAESGSDDRDTFVAEAYEYLAALPYNEPNAWRVSERVVEKSNEQDALSGAIKTLALHYVHDQKLLREAVPKLLAKKADQLRGKPLSWKDIADLGRSLQVPYRFGSARLDKKAGLACDTPKLLASLNKMDVMAVRLPSGPKPSDYVILKRSATDYVAVHTGSGLSLTLELDMQADPPGMGSALRALLERTKQTACDVLFIYA
ncbi:MAG: hypothetical protein KKC79_16775 [Gammaproteobacteria bacterium]|nr:hypothetical protein [Gammaproteobacteria bacterium]